MTTYSIIHNGTGELVRDNITSDQLQAADRLLRVSKRLGLHQTASSRANARDRGMRYGTNYRHPEGTAKPQTFRTRSSVPRGRIRRTEPVSLQAVVLDLVKGFFGALGQLVGF